jgi:hypothetical protein
MHDPFEQDNNGLAHTMRQPLQAQVLPQHNMMNATPMAGHHAGKTIASMGSGDPRDGWADAVNQTQYTHTPEQRSNIR